MALGFAIGRWWALAVPVALTSSLFFGVDQDWWGGGLTDHWQAEFAAFSGIGIVLAAAGALLLVGMRRLRLAGSRLRIGLVVACIAALAGYWFVETRPPDLDELRASPHTIYYLGDSFEGLRLTRAELQGRQAYFAYGDCDSALGYTHDGGCGAPLQFRNVACPGGAPGVAIISSTGGGQAYRAIRALEPVREDEPRGRLRAWVGAGDPLALCSSQ